jgi:nucleotide-binding universal stress UspA family protein
MRWTKILVPHDFSASADHAAVIARDEAKAHAASLLVLHVVDTALPQYLRDEAVTAAEDHLREVQLKLAADNVRLTTYVRVGHPVDEINQFCKETSCDLIVMGTHGRSGLAHLLIGSVTERVVRTSPVPVLTIRHRE